MINDRHKLLPSINLPAARLNDGKVGSLKKKNKNRPQHDLSKANEEKKKILQALLLLLWKEERWVECVQGC